MAALILAASAGTGCSNDKAITPPMTQMPMDQMNKKIQQDAQSMAAYRMSHPLNTPNRGPAQ